MTLSLCPGSNRRGGADEREIRRRFNDLTASKLHSVDPYVSHFHELRPLGGFGFDEDGKFRWRVAHCLHAHRRESFLALRLRERHGNLGIEFLDNRRRGLRRYEDAVPAGGQGTTR